MHVHNHDVVGAEAARESLPVQVLQLLAHQRRRRPVRAPFGGPRPELRQAPHPQGHQRVVIVGLLALPPLLAAAHGLEHEVVRVRRDAVRLGDARQPRRRVRPPIPIAALLERRGGSVLGLQRAHLGVVEPLAVVVTRVVPRQFLADVLS